MTGDRDLLDAYLAVDVLKCADVIARITKTPEGQEDEGRGSRRKVKEKRT